MDIKGTGGKTIDCPDGTQRLEVDCNAVSSLKERVIAANLGIPKIGLGFSGSYEERALGQISESTQQMAVGFEAKCRQYNACAINSAEWTGSEDKIRQQLTTHVDLSQELKDATDDTRAIIGNTIWGNAIPDLAAKQLSIMYALEVKPKDATEFHVHQSGDPLTSGDEFRLRIKTSKTAYVYLLLLSSQAETSQLFPMKEINLSNPIEPGRETLLPDTATGTFELDKVTGTEHLQILASTTPLTDIESRLKELAKLNEASNTSNTEAPKAARQNILKSIGNLLCEGNDAARARGVNLKPTTVDCGGIRTRGVLLKKQVQEGMGTSREKISSVVAEPNDNVVVIQHRIVHI